MMLSVIRTLALTIGLATVALGRAMPAKCMAMYKVVHGDTCMSIVDQHPNTLTVEELRMWNPSVNVECTNLMTGMEVCIRQLSANDCLRT